MAINNTLSSGLLALDPKLGTSGTTTTPYAFSTTNKVPLAPSPTSTPTPQTVGSNITSLSAPKPPVAQSTPNFSTGISSGSNPSSGLVTPQNTVGQKAPTGMEYNGQGQLVPMTTPQNTSGAPGAPGTPQNSNLTVGGLVPQLLGASNNPDFDKINQEEQRQLGDTLTGQPGQPLDLAQGRAGLIENTANLALGNALQKQQLKQSGLVSALGAVAPITGVPYGTQTIQPGLIGSQGSSSGGGVSPSDPFYQTLQTYAQQLVNNQGSSIPSSVTGNPVLQAQLLQMAKQIDPNFNYNTAQGIGQGQTQVGATGGAITSQQEQQVAGYKSAQQQAQNVGSQLIDLIKTTGVNPNDVNAVNQGFQKIAANTSDPNYQALHNYVASIANLYSQILTPAGGSGTDTTREIASSMLDSSASGKTIMQVMQQLDSEAQARIAGVPTTSSGSSSQFSGSAWQ